MIMFLPGISLHDQLMCSDIPGIPLHDQLMCSASYQVYPSMTS